MNWQHIPLLILLTNLQFIFPKKNLFFGGGVGCDF